MARMAGADYGGTAFSARLGGGLLGNGMARRGLVALPLQLVGGILEMVLEGFNLMDLDGSIIDHRSLVGESLAGCKGLDMSVGTDLYDGDLLHGADTCKVGGSLCVFYGLSLFLIGHPTDGWMWNV